MPSSLPRKPARPSLGAFLPRGFLLRSSRRRRPIRRILPDFGALDFSPLVVLLVIQILRSIVLPAIERSALGA